MRKASSIQVISVPTLQEATRVVGDSHVYMHMSATSP